MWCAAGKHKPTNHLHQKIRINLLQCEISYILWQHDWIDEMIKQKGQLGVDRQEVQLYKFNIEHVKKFSF